VGLRAGLDRCGKSRPTGIRSPDRPARRQSLYRLPTTDYPASLDLNRLNLAWLATTTFMSLAKRHVPSWLYLTKLSEHFRFYECELRIRSRVKRIFRGLRKICEKRLLASSFLSVRPPACKDSAPTRQIFHGIWYQYFSKSMEKIQD